MKKVNTKFDYIVAIIVNLILLYVFNNLLNWHISFLLPSWAKPLFFINLLIFGRIITTLVYLFYDPFWFKALTKTILNIVSFVFMLTIYYVFPFDFLVYPHLPWLPQVIKIAIIISLSLTTLGIIVEFISIFKPIVAKKNK